MITFYQKLYYKCNFKDCLSSFTQSFALKSHINAIHTKENVYYCKECGYYCYHKSSLKKHIQSIHSGIVKEFIKKEERIMFDFLKANNIIFDYNNSIDFCDMTDNKQRAFGDFIIQGRSAIFILEIDERNGHSARNLKFDSELDPNKEVKCEDDNYAYNVSCEQARMMNIIASLRAEGYLLPIIFIRYNPQSFKKDRLNLSRPQEDRLSTILNFIQVYEPKQELEIHYYCYDEYVLKDQNRTRRVCVWDHKDFDPKLQECLFII